jgi:predicted nucleotidyltransferase
MDTTLDSDPVLAEIVRRLVEAYQPERIYLFGSKASGDASPDSDYDLMVVVPNDAPTERRQSRLAYERLWGTNSAADVLVWTREVFDSRMHLKASLPATILRGGAGHEAFTSNRLKEVILADVQGLDLRLKQSFVCFA